MTKGAFICDSMQTILANWQLYIQQYVHSTQNAMARYWNANELSLKSISEDSNGNCSENEGESGQLDIPILK